MGHFTVSSYLVAHVVRVMQALGHEPAAALAHAGITSDNLAHPDDRLPLPTAEKFWRAAVRQSGVPHLGLACAEDLHEGYPSLRYAMRNSATLATALQRLARFYRLITDIADPRLDREQHRGLMRTTVRAAYVLPNLLEDWMVGTWLTLGRFLVRTDWTPELVWMVRAVPADPARYRRWFGADVTFGAPESCMSIPNAVLELPIPDADGTLLGVLDRHVADVARRIPQASSLADSVREVLARELSDGEPSAARVADQLKLSQRTLQRRLTDDGTSLKRILNDLRHRLSLRYLDDPAVSVTEVAFLLGFSEPAAFTRAFKRWTGTTPLSHRRARA